MVYAENDPVVPLAQGEEMARALPNTQLIVLPPGPVSFERSLAPPGTDRGGSASAYEKALAALGNSWPTRQAPCARAETGLTGLFRASSEPFRFDPTNLG